MTSYFTTLEGAISAFNVALQAGGAVQDYRYHSQDVDLNKTLHEREIELARELHEKEVEQAKDYHHREMNQAGEFHKFEMETSKKIYLWDASTQMEQHLQQLNADLINANREADRDMYEQRNSQFQTIIVSATVMFAALCTVIIEGQLPVNSGRLIEVGMAIFAGSSFALLFLSIILSLEIVFRTTRYMYERARTHNTTLVNLVMDMKGVMADLEDMRKLATIESPDEIDAAFNQHYKNMQKFMAWRESINEHMFRGQNTKKGEIKAKIDASRAHDVTRLKMLRRAITLWRRRSRATDLEITEQREFSESCEDGATVDQQGGFQSFSVFWDKHCEFVSSVALLCFYGGTALLLLDIALFVYAKFKFTYNNSMAGRITGLFVFGALFVGLVLLGYFRFGNVVIFRRMQHWKDDQPNSSISSGGSGSGRNRELSDDDVDVEGGLRMRERRTNARRRTGSTRSAMGEEKIVDGTDVTRYASFRGGLDIRDLA